MMHQDISAGCVDVIRDPDLGGFRRPLLLEEILRMFADHGVRPLVYGGTWRDWIALGTLEHTPDVDLHMTVADYRRLPRDVRDMFRQQPAQRRFQKAMFRKFGMRVWSLDRPFVMESRAAFREAMGIGIGLTLANSLPAPEVLVLETDLGFCQVVDDGDALYTTPLFWEDIRQRQMTLVRCRDARDFTRSHRRMNRFRNGRYAGWSPGIADEHLHRSGIVLW